MKHLTRILALAAALASSGVLAAGTLMGGTAPPQVSVADVNPGTAVERDLCLSVSVGPGAASECGDLRLAHALPAVRTLNQARAPVLLYNSQHASPHPVVAAHVMLPSGAAGLSRVVAILRVNGTPRGQGVWKGTAWPGGGPVRIAVGYDAGGDATGPYRYALEVRAHYGTTVVADTARGELVVVNRRESPFGAGWWLAGLERLVMDPTGRPLLWVGGDGSTRRYTVTADTAVWGAASLDRPDTLKRAGAGWERILPGGVRVRFDAAGNHVATRSRVGYETSFGYVGGRLGSVSVPPAGSALSYSFVYGTDGFLQRVEAPGVQGTRTVTLTRAGDELSIQDPDGTRIAFTHADGTRRRIVARSDRLGRTTVFRYDAGGRIASSRHDLAGDSIVTRLTALESLGLAAAVDTAQAFALLDGPRTDVLDHTRLWLDRWGAPRRVRDALGRETRITRGDPRFPALVTRVEQPGGRVMGAEYDGRGNLAAQTDSSTRNAAGRYATTRYAYDTRWDAVTRVTLPEGEVTISEYDDSARVRWVQQGNDTLRRTRFLYHPLGVNGGGLPSSVKGPLATAERMAYDALGNLQESSTVDQGTTLRTHHQRDAIGRDTLVTNPAGARSILRYDAAGRVVETLSIGPATEYNNQLTFQLVGIPEQKLWVYSYFDAEGRPDSIARGQSPDPSAIGRIVTRWRRDALGRQVQEIAPDATPANLADNPRDSTVFDAAGNAVAVRSRRGLWTRMEYDALSRLTARRGDAASYGPLAVVVGDSIRRTLRFPLFAQDAEGNFTLANTTGSAGLTIRGDTATFEYDAAGNMTGAINRDAVVRREYNVNGTMRSETQRIRTYAGLDTTAHTYRLEYTYDLNGRRTSLTHPQIFDLSAPRQTGYGYDTIAGALAFVSDPNGGGYTYRYDLAGRVDQRTRGSVVEAFSYDSLGRLEHRVETSGGVAVHDDHLAYKDSTGKLIAVTSSVTGKSGSANLAYTGMGALAYSDETDRSGRGIRKTEAYETDALGNQLSSSFWSTPLTTYVPADADTYARVYEPATGRLIRSQSSSLPAFSLDSSTYDPAGNRVFSGSRRAGKAPYGLTREWQRQSIYEEPTDAVTDERATYYYGADERLRVVDRRGCLSFYPYYNRQGCDQQMEPAFEKKSAFEEYRYDALGRRVLVRTRQEFACTSNCFRQLRRAIWDGDQLLYEIAAPGQSGAGPAMMERDTGLAPSFKTGFYQTGRVEYVHGAELDAPLALYRAEYSDSIGGGYYIPLANWKGSYDGGYSIEQCYTREWSTAVAPPVGPQIGSDTTKSNATSGTEELCPTIEWPAQHEWTARQYRRGYGGPRTWMGSLIYGQRDFSGLHYRRNRFYDSEQGRFTQEDPIGLAGGINLYGFANGDPVGYSDPFGLSAEDNTGDCRIKATRCPRSAQELVRNRDVQRFARELLRRSRADNGREYGAFLFRNRDGSIRMGQVYRGQRGTTAGSGMPSGENMPANAIARVHTHPDEVHSGGFVLPGREVPSPGDVINANRGHVWGVVVTERKLLIIPVDKNTYQTYDRPQP